MNVGVSLRRRLKSLMLSVYGGAATLCCCGHEGDLTEDNETKLSSLDGRYELPNSPPFQTISSHFSLTGIR